MNENVREILEGIKDGKVSVEEALLELKKKPFEDIGYAKVDMHRKIRQGTAEVIYGAGKTAEQIAVILQRLRETTERNILATRCDPEKAADVLARDAQAP